MIEKFLQSLRAEARYSPATLQLTEKWLQDCLAFTPGRQLLALRYEDLQMWHQSLFWLPGRSGKLYAQNTIIQAMGAVRRFYRWARAQDLLSDDPSAGICTPYVKGKERWKPSSSEARQLLAMPMLDTPIGARDRALLGVLMETGVSFPACSRIDLRHLQMDTGTLLTHGRFRRLHTLCDGLIDDLEHYLEQSRPALVCQQQNPALFINVRGERLSAQGIRVRLQGYRQKLQHSGFLS